MYVVPINWVTASTVLLKPPVSKEWYACYRIRHSPVTQRISLANFSTLSFLSFPLSKAVMNPKMITRY